MSYNLSQKLQSCLNCCANYGLLPKNYLDTMSIEELILWICKFLQEEVLPVVEQDNAEIKELRRVVESLDIDKIEAEIASFLVDFENFKKEIQREIVTRFAQITVELHSMIASTLTQANAYTDTVANQLSSEIEQISVGNIEIYDPTTGILSPLQTVINNMYGSSRDDALTATEYDELELAAADYDNYQITAFNYDKYGKTLLV